MLASPCTLKVPVLPKPTSKIRLMLPVPVQVAVPALFTAVLPLAKMVLSLEPLMFSALPAGMFQVTGRIVPLVQFMTPVTVRVPPIINELPSKSRLVTLTFEPALTEAPALMTAESALPGTPLGVQLAAVNQSLPEAPVQVKDVAARA